MCLSSLKKIPTLSCITNNKTQTTYIPVTSTLAQQSSNKGRKRVIFHEPDQATTPAAYTLNLNTYQQELLRLHETYAHKDMKEIQQQIKNCKIKASRQVATCYIPKCLSCSENKGKRDLITNTAGPSHKMITTLSQTYRYTTRTQLMSPGTPGNIKDGPHSRNTRISCYSLTTKQV
jgi:hypothetical protein